MATDIQIRTYADFQKYNFFRTPAWRHDRVLSLIEREDGTPGRCTKRDDDIVKIATPFIHRWKKGNKLSRERLLWENPGLYYAYEFILKTIENQDASMYIQSRLLARQSVEEVANIMGMIPDAVTWYANLVFDVLPYLDQRDWITSQILVPAMTRSMMKPSNSANPLHQDSSVAKPFLDGSLKFFAYFGGRHMVDYLVTGAKAGKPVASPDDIDLWFDNDAKTTIRKRTAQAARLFEINKYNVMELFQVHTRIMEIERADEAIEQTKDTHERTVRAMMDEIPWAIGADGERIYEQDMVMVGRMDKMAGEVRDDELLLLASGRPAPSIADNFPSKLPPPRRGNVSIITNPSTELQ